MLFILQLMLAEERILWPNWLILPELSRGMEFDSPDGRDDDEDNGVGFVNISTILDARAHFTLE